MPFQLRYSLLTQSLQSSERSSALNDLSTHVEPLIKADKPWESYCLGYCQVIRTDGKWRMWYGSFDRKYQNDSNNFLCYAESSDGLHWNKPDLNLVMYDGSRHNNIILQAGVIGPSIFIDADAPPSDRYKMAYVKWTGSRWPVFGATSPDGLHWALGNKPLLDFNSDTQQTCFRDGAGYRLFVRMWSGPKDFEGRRIVGESFSSSFGRFPPPRQILDVDERDPSNMQFYNSAVTKLAKDFILLCPRDFTKAKICPESMPRSATTVSISYAWEPGHFWMWGADSIVWHYMLRPVRLLQKNRGNIGCTILAAPRATTSRAHRIETCRRNRDGF